MKENKFDTVKNVGNKNSIEEDIKILEELRIANENCIKNAKNKDNPFVAIWKKQNRAIEHILSSYKKVLKENDELKKSKITYERVRNIQIENKEIVNKKYISKQKIKDEIEELKGKLEDISKRREKSKTKEEETVLWCLEIRTDERIKTLQELL